jgi:hypothetical protein
LTSNIKAIFNPEFKNLLNTTETAEPGLNPFIKKYWLECLNSRYSIRLKDQLKDKTSFLKFLLENINKLILEKKIFNRRL